MIKNKHKEQTRAQRENDTCGKNHDRVRQNRLGGNTGRTSDANDFVVGFCRDSSRVLILLKLLEQLGRYLLLALNLHQPRLGGYDLLVDFGYGGGHPVAVLLVDGKLVAEGSQVAVRSSEGA